MELGRTNPKNGEVNLLSKNQGIHVRDFEAVDESIIHLLTSCSHRKKMKIMSIK